jgi:hypothetical protein
MLFDFDWNAYFDAHPPCNKTMSDTYPSHGRARAPRVDFRSKDEML